MNYFEIKNIIKGTLRDETPVDDFRIVDSYALYEEKAGQQTSKRKLKYLCYEIESINPETGEKHHFYKALKFVRIIRLPKSAKQSTSFMDMQQQILTGVYEQGCNLVTIIANMIEPALGLLFLYGVQGVADNIDDAKKIADQDYIRLTTAFQGTFRVLEMRCLIAEETEWLRDKMYNMNYMTVVRGIPKANKSGEDMGNKGIGGKNINPDSQGTLEEFIIGMTDYEYVVQVLSTPVFLSTLKEWSLQTEKHMSDWNSQLQGTSAISLSVSMPMMFGANSSNSQGWSKAYTDADTVTTSTGESFTTSFGENVGESIGKSFGESMGISQGQSVTNSISQSQSVSNGVTLGQTIGESAGISSSFGNSMNISQGESMNQSESQSVSDSLGISTSESYGKNFGTSVSNSHSLGTSETVGNSFTDSVGTSNTASVSQTTTEGTTLTNSHGVSSTSSISNSTTHTDTGGTSGSHSRTIGSSTGTGTNEGSSASSNSGGSVSILGIGVNGGNSDTTSTGKSTNSSVSDSTTSGSGWSKGFSDSRGTTVGNSWGESNTVSASSSASLSTGSSISEGRTHTQSVGSSNSWGTSESYGVSTGETSGESFGLSSGTTQSQSVSNGVNKGWGSSISASNGISTSNGYNSGQSVSNSQSASQTVSQGITQGTSVGTTTSQSYTQSTSESTTKSYGQSQSVSEGTSTSKSIGESHGISAGTSGAYVSGMSSSMGFGPSIGYNKSYAWLDQQVKDILEILEFQNERLKRSLRGEGAFYTYVYIACPSQDALSAAQAVAKSTWQNEFALVNPLQVLNLSYDEQKHLLYHFSAFSVDVTRENVAGEMQYKYSTVLLPNEYVAYTHLPRVSEGGVFADVNDIPKFAVPSQLKGEIYMGTVLSAERYSMNNGYRTPFDFRIDEKELMHGFFTGASRSGKTVAAMRFVAELANVKRKETGKKLRIVCMDPKQDWRTLARFVDPKRFRFYSLGNASFRPVYINPFKIPHGVIPQTWIDGVIDIYCRAYGLLERGKQMLGETIYALYEEAGVFAACDEDDWMNTVPELSRQVTFPKVYKKMEYIKASLEDPTNKKGRAGNDTRDAYARLLDRLQCFSREFSIEYKLFGSTEGLGVDELIGDDDVTILESSGLEKTFKNFIFGVITSGFYKYAKAHEGGYLAEDQYETVLVIEEANEVLIGNDAAGSGGGSSMGLSVSGQSEFEEILDQSAGYGLFIIAITQKIADMPKSIIANSGLVFAGRLKTEKDINVCIRSIAREERYDDRDIVKWFPRMATGMFICQRSRTFDFKDAEPILVQIARLNAVPPSNLEIDEMLTRQKAVNSVEKWERHKTIA